MARRKRQQTKQNRGQTSSGNAKRHDETLGLDRVLELIQGQTIALQRAEAKRNSLVEEARQMGGSWSQIGRAADLTPQGAHSRWRER